MRRKKHASRRQGARIVRKEKASGRSHAGRDELAAILEFFRPGDEQVVVKLDRLGPPIPEPRGSVLQKKHGNRLSFLAEIAFGRVPPRLPIPIAGIGKIALDAMQPSMDPCTFGARIVLSDVVSGVPFPAEPVPHGEK
jgi:hypothetical protein